jgi:hypothetical protein
MTIPVVASSFEKGTSAFRWSSDLAAEEFAPIAMSGVPNSIYGMARDGAIYLCVVADSSENQAKRKLVLLAELAGENPEPMLPNIPVTCILT